jgi:hypothetical protein
MACALNKWEWTLCSDVWCIIYEAWQPPALMYAVLHVITRIYCSDAWLADRNIYRDACVSLFIRCRCILKRCFPQEPHNYQLVDILTYRPFTSKPHGQWTNVTLVMMMMMKIMITIMSMGWDYVSVLPPTYLLFIHYVIYERGESWIEYCKGVILTRSPELTEIVSTVSWAKGMTIWPWEVFLFILASNFLHVKCYDSGPPASLTHRRKLCCGFL